MLVIAIIGILAALAIPAFHRYLKKARNAEAVGHLQKMWAGSVAYYEADHTDSNTTVLEKQFPGTGTSAPAESTTACACITPGGRCQGSAAAWEDPIWMALNFSMADPHLFMAGYSASGTGLSAKFVSEARADLDCDSVFAVFQRSGVITAGGDVQGAMIPYIVNDGE